VSLALYRKYRPGSFSEVKGQEHVTGPLQQALRNGRIHHAYLFSGPRGCGKTSSARILARSLNCDKGPTPDPCGVCDSCVALAPMGPGSLDVVEIDAASHGGVDDARDLRERAFYAPVSSPYKIYIIDEAHMVSREGFNALLKLVEEPPDFLRFVFATTEPEKVLSTIRSRTHHYPFRLMPRRELTDLLAGIVEQEGIPVDPTVLPLVVRAAAGSARDGLSILDQVLASAGAEGVTREAAAALLGVTPDTLLDDVMDAFAARDGASVFATVDRVMENGHDPRRFAADVLERLRDLVVLDAVPEAGEKGLLDCPPEQLAAMSRQATNLGTAGLSRAADLFHAGLTEMRGTTSPRLLLELVCARVLLPAASSDDAAVMTRLERLERRFDIGGPPAAPSPGDPRNAQRSAAPVSSPSASVDHAGPPVVPPSAPAGDPRNAQGSAAPVPTSAGSVDHGGWPAAAVPGAPSTPAPAAPVAPVAPTTAPSVEAPTVGGLDATALRRSWDAVLQAANERKRVTKALLDNAQVLDLTGRTLTLAFTTAALSRQFQAGSNIEVLKESLQAVLGLDADIALVVAGEQPPLPPVATATTRPADPQSAPPTPAYEGFAPGDEIDPEDPDAPQPERQVGGEDAALKLVADQLGGTVVGTVEP
jgi:DNA polymerase-3 subunit gamma/tau